MSESYGPVLKVSDLDHSRPHEIDVKLDTDSADALATALGIDGMRKVRLSGRLAPFGKADWRFEGNLGATVVQPCVVTLAPVTTRIEAPVERSWLRDLPPVKAEESETPDDVSVERLGSEIDFGTVLAEAVALNLPDYPRAEGAELEDASFTEPGRDPMSDDDAKPFAGLAALRDQLAGKAGDGPDDDQ